MARILIIDDDQDMIDSMTMILEGTGYKVVAKKDTDNLLDDVAAANPDIIILDVIFPEDPHAGFKAARTLSKDQRLSHIPVLLLSAVNQMSNMAFGFSEDDISDDFMPVGGFIEKPVEPKVLLDRIEKMLNPAGGD